MYYVNVKLQSMRNTDSAQMNQQEIQQLLKEKSFVNLLQISFIFLNIF